MSMSESAQPESRFGLMRAITKFQSSPAAQGRAAPARARDPEPAPAAREDGVERWPLPGLAPMTRVRTSFGDVHAIALRKGDEVLVRSGVYRPILWINRIKLDEQYLNLKPDAHPILLSPNALGGEAPTNEMMVSPRQVIAADERSALSSPREAAMLVSRPGVRRIRETGLSYTLFHIGAEADVYCEGLWLQFPMEA